MKIRTKRELVSVILIPLSLTVSRLYEGWLGKYKFSIKRKELLGKTLSFFINVNIFILITWLEHPKRKITVEVDKKNLECKIYSKFSKKLILFFQMLFTNLSVNQEYLLKVQALTSSLYQENLIYPGTVSEVLGFHFFLETRISHFK